ncbi:two-component hybrid sensor and regulator [Geitlerinema sp. FC II]|nr:two-component hybrid sensor and regulator [Geitlerinema sp. FC II]
MPFEEPSTSIPTLEEAIDRFPLVVPPNAAVLDVIASMSCIREDRCTFAPHTTSSSVCVTQRQSCALVADADRRILGIFTERDLVRLTATGVPLSGQTIADVMTCPVVTLSETDLQDIFAALFLFRRYRIRHLAIVDDRDRWVGIVTPNSIRRVIRPSNLLKLRRVSEVMTSPVVCAPSDVPLVKVAHLMANARVSCVVLTTEDIDDRHLPIGIVTERDIVQFQSLELDVNTLDAATVMSSPLFLLKPEDSLWTAHQEMQKRHVRRMVVSWDWGYQLGIVTQTSLLRIFDPLEMYGVVETLQRTVRELTAQRVVGLTTSVLPRSQVAPDRAHAALLTVRACLEQLAGYPELQPYQCHASLDRALSELQILERELGCVSEFPDFPSERSI